MAIRKAIGLAGLALGVALLGPASVLADVGGTDRPMSGSGSGTSSVNFQTRTLTADLTGVAAHLGEFTSHSEGIVAISSAGVTASGDQTIVAANGDQLTGTFSLTGPPFTPSVHTDTLVITISGGTGRFADASGTVTATIEVTPIAFDGVTVHTTFEGTLTGEISY